MLKRSEKDTVIANLKTDFESAKAVFLTNVIGVTSNDAVALRKDIRDANGKLVVTRNTLFRRASEGTPAEAMLSNLKGPHALAFAFEDAVGVAKALKVKSKEFDVIQLLGGVLDGKVLEIAEVQQLADLPSREEMLGTLLATFNAPVSAFARLMNSIKDECEGQGVENPAGLKVEAAQAAE